MQFIFILFVQGIVLGSGLVWESLPKGFNLSQPDNILGLVREKHKTSPKFPFTHVYVFGDSTCDTGNYARRINYANPLKRFYWNNRLSNGPIFVDYLQAINNVRVKNFCHAGSMINKKNHVIEAGVPDFLDQIELYKKSQYEPKPLRALALLNFAANDFLTPTVSPETVEADFKLAMDKLIKAGDFKDVLILKTLVNDRRKPYFDRTVEAFIENAETEYKDMNISYLSISELAFLMIAVPSPLADVISWSPIVSCFNQTSAELCKDPGNHLLHDFYHFSTVTQYNLAVRISRFISALWR